ncbi:SGNH/GDSL hydrolase family protein [soil metagenome]
MLVVSAFALAACGSDADSGGGGATGASGASGAAGAAGGTLRYAVIGDSNSNGENAGPGQQASPDKIAWPAQLAASLNEQGLPTKLVANPAISGATIEQAVAEELPAFKKAKPDVATLMIGGNDYVGGVTPEQYRKSYRELLDTMVETVGDPERMFTVSVPAFYLTPTGATYVNPDAAPDDVAEFNDIARAESEDAGVEFVDIVGISEAMGDDSSLVTPDGLHPTEKEAGLWTDEIAPVAAERWSELSG